MKLIEFLDRSAVAPEFAAALHEFVHSGAPNGRLVFDAGLPPVKVARTLTRMLEEFPRLPIEEVAISARSGCEYFRGELTIHAAGEERRIRFEWNCRWRAESAGWVDYFGFPDQIRAAREFGYDCFRGWEEVPPAADAA